jgi:tight adherence protein B
MNVLAVSMILGAIIMLLLALWMFKHSKETRFRERMMHNFREAIPFGATVSGSLPAPPPPFWQLFKIRASIYAGFELQKKHAVSIPMAFIAAGMVGWLTYGVLGAALTFFTTIFIFGFLLPYSRLRRRQAQIVAQIPLFIDQILRSLSTGRSLESAIRFAAGEALPPLRYVLDRVIRAADLGADMVETLAEAAKLHNLRELNLIALAMRISNNYGSSPRDMLDSVVRMIRQQELARSELAAMTGETRMSAWVLGLTPLLIGGYIIVMNPSYLDILLKDPSGQAMLTTALALQGIGAFILWRMLRSV